MTNPINPLNRTSTGTVSNNTDNVQSRKDEVNSNAPRATSEDTVSLSQKSQQVAGLQQQLKDSPAIDQAKVDSIKQEIANGNYPLDASKIAENLISLEQSLLE